MPPPTEAKERRKLALEAVERLRADLRATFTPPAGARVLDHLRRVCNAHVPSYIPGTSTNDCLFAEGRRSVLLEIEAELRTPEAKPPDETPTVIKQ